MKDFHARALLAVLVPTAALIPAAPAALAAQHQPTASAALATRLTCLASMTSSHPRDYTDTGVRVRTVAAARVKTIAHYRTANHQKRGTANAHGRVTIWYYISGATPGYNVKVSVYVSKGKSTGSCSASFTPHS